MSGYIEIAKLVGVSRPTAPTLRIGLNPQDAKKELDAIAKKLDRFQSISKKIAKKAGEDTDADTIELIAESELELLKSFFAPEFASQYKSQISTYDSREKLAKFLQSVFRSESSDQQKLEVVRKNLQKCARHASQSETFECFLDRLQTLGKEIEPLTSAET